MSKEVDNDILLYKSYISLVGNEEDDSQGYHLGLT
jgi:hypothetical protein